MRVAPVTPLERLESAMASSTWVDSSERPVSRKWAPGKHYSPDVWQTLESLVGPVPSEYQDLLRLFGAIVVAREYRLLDLPRQGRRGISDYIQLLNLCAAMENPGVVFGVGGLVPWGNTAFGDILCWQWIDGACEVVVVDEDIMDPPSRSHMSIAEFLAFKLDEFEEVVPHPRETPEGQW